MVYSFFFPPLLIYFTNLLILKKRPVIFQEKWFLRPGWLHSVEHQIEYLQSNCKGCCPHQINSQKTHGNLLCVEQNIAIFIVWQHCPFFFFNYSHCTSRQLKHSQFLHRSPVEALPFGNLIVYYGLLLHSFSAHLNLQTLPSMYSSQFVTKHPAFKGMFLIHVCVLKG